MVTIGYRDPMDASYVNLKRSAMNYQQKKESKNHYKAIRISLNSITYNEYEKITNKDSPKSNFDSLRMTYEVNELVKETKALALIKKYEAFNIEDILRKCSQGFKH
jgi:hypothetical protein